MPRVTYITADGESRAFDAEVGANLMQLATSEGVPGIIGDCGGSMSCATCHVYVEPEWFDRLRQPKAEETAMLEFADEPRDNSRLGCQIRVTPELDGIVVRVPG